MSEVMESLMRNSLILSFLKMDGCKISKIIKRVKLGPFFIKRKNKSDAKRSTTSEDICRLYLQLDVNNETFYFLVLGCFELREVKKH